MEHVLGYLSSISSILVVALGLGLVIFVHELGHFAVAKWVGVKVERFSLGFGRVLWGFTYRGTEYALSAIPFGGYVKMLGQDDNPANTQQERERSKLANSPATEAASAETQGAAALAPAATTTERGKAIAEERAAEGFVTGQTVERADQLDPHSYQAKSVPQRMAIISAGVIMNIIFGFLFFLLVFNLGVPFTPPLIGSVEPGGPAWQAGLQRGDRVLAVNDEEITDFEDLVQEVMLSDPGQELELRVARADATLALRVVSQMSEFAPHIGVGPSSDLKLDKESPVIKGMAASQAKGAQFRGGDRLTHVNDRAVHSYPEFTALLAEYAGAAVRIRVVRAPQKGTSTQDSATIEVPGQFMRDLGIRLEMGKITAIRTKSAAAAAGLRVDDLIQTIGGMPCDPLRLPHLMTSLAGQEIQIEFKRPQDSDEISVLTVRPENIPAWITPPRSPGDPITVPALGIAYHMVPTITEQPHPNSPAGLAGLQKGDRIIAAMIVRTPENAEKLATPKEIEIGEKNLVLPAIYWLLQQEPLAQLKLKVTRGGEDIWTQAFSPKVDPDLPAPFRGLALGMHLSERLPAQGLSQSMVLGYRTTKRTMTKIYLMLRRLLISHTVSMKALTGPVGIAVGGFHIAATDIMLFIKFLAMLSVNLAIVNFLPIPVLDGGHMLFLAWEGIRGKPASEKVILAANYCGFLLIITLALLVTGHDIWRLVK